MFVLCHAIEFSRAFHHCRFAVLFFSFIQVLSAVLFSPYLESYSWLLLDICFKPSLFTLKDRLTLAKLQKDATKEVQNIAHILKQNKSKCFKLLIFLIVFVFYVKCVFSLFRAHLNLRSHVVPGDTFDIRRVLDV
jgi:hypothetical protein